MTPLHQGLGEGLAAWEVVKDAGLAQADRIRQLLKADRIQAAVLHQLLSRIEESLTHAGILPIGW